MLPEKDPRHDQRLEYQFQQGDEQAFGHFFSAHRSEILCFLRRRIRDLGQADDLTEEVFVRAWENHASFDPRRGALRSWLYILAKSVWSNYLRKMKRRIESFVSEFGNDSDLGDAIERTPSKEPSIEGRLISEEYVVDCLVRLSEPLRDVIELMVLQDLSAQEVAEILDIPVGTVYSRKSNALKMLREIIVKEQILKEL